MAHQQFRQALLVDWNTAELKLGHLACIIVDTKNRITNFGETTRRNKSDIAGAKPRNFSESLKLKIHNFPFRTIRTKQEGSAEINSFRQWITPKKLLLSSFRITAPYL